LAVIQKSIFLRINLFFLWFIILALFGCEQHYDKSLIRDSSKLVSPSGRLVLYRYYIETSMSFGSGFTVIKILDANEKCDYTDPNFFRFGNNHPFWVKWKNENTLSVKCFNSGGGLMDKQPYKRDTIVWEDYTFETEYYTIFSTGLGGDQLFEDYSVDSQFVAFNRKDGSLKLAKNEIQFLLDTNNISGTHFRIDTFSKGKIGLSFTSYDFKPLVKYNQRDFLKDQPFIKTKP
jgi:hypothetical protein